MGAEGHLFCLEAKTGGVLWSRDFKKDFGIKTPMWGFAGHPLLEGDKLICLAGGAGSTVVAFDKNTGKELWRALSAAEPGYSSFAGNHLWQTSALGPCFPGQKQPPFLPVQ